MGQPLLRNPDTLPKRDAWLIRNNQQGGKLQLRYYRLPVEKKQPGLAGLDLTQNSKASLAGIVRRLLFALLTTG
jgi:hypothetical protein